MSKDLSIRPPMNVYQILRNLSYTITTAVPEFVDNSIASFRKNAQIFKKAEEAGKNVEKSIMIIFNRKEKEIIVRDTAFGIAEEDYVRALKLKSVPDDQTGLNEFGMGLKAAAFWFGDNLEIISKCPKDAKTEFGKGVYMSLTKKDMELERETVQATPFDAANSGWAINHGTVIKVTDVVRDISNEMAKKCVESISRKYKRDILNNGIKIFCYAVEANGKLLDINAWKNGVEKEKAYHDKTQLKKGTPFSFCEPEILKDENNEDYKRKISFDVSWEEKTYHVKGEIFVRKKGSRKEAGIDLFRRDRIVVDRFTDFIPDQSSFEYQRVNGSLDLDEFPITQAKDRIDWEGGFFETVFKKFHSQSEVKEIIKVARTYRQTPENTDKQAEQTVPQFIKTKIQLGETTEVLSADETMNIAEEHSIKYRTTDVAHHVKTNEGERIIYSRLDSSGKMSTWLELDEKQDDLTIVNLDINHIFFNPFNDLKENGKFGEVFINTMREFSIYWAWAEKESIDKAETADEFRQRLSELIEQNKR